MIDGASTEGARATLIRHGHILSLIVAHSTRSHTPESGSGIRGVTESDRTSDEVRVVPAPGDLVELHFEGTFDDGVVFDTSRGRRARAFVLGRGQLLPAFEAALFPLEVGETAAFRLEPGEAYGLVLPELFLEAPSNELPPGAAVGDEVALTGGRPARITAIEGDTVTLDANHPLAGRALNFTVKLLSVAPAS